MSGSRRVLITGAAGFVGRALARVLSLRGFAVSGLDLTEQVLNRRMADELLDTHPSPVDEHPPAAEMLVIGVRELMVLGEQPVNRISKQRRRSKERDATNEAKVEMAGNQRVLAQ